jgi:spore maturation protein CgeB
MRVVIFCHSLISDWNHGNAHFLRGIASELIARGCDLRVYEPADAWSFKNLIAEYGEAPVRRFHEAYPQLESTRYDPEKLDLSRALDAADLVLVHEWNDPDIVRRIGVHRIRSGGYTLLFHDTHHRSVTDPASMSSYELDNYDGVLAFGNSIADVYRRRGWASRVWTWHEAADARIFRPIQVQSTEGDLVWIGNWGDDERTSELSEFLISPVSELRLKARVHGVRYPEAARHALSSAGIEYAGWAANFDVPRIFAGFRVTVHVPRGPYAKTLPGIPTIRMFEALACGIPLVSAPWSDTEGLFTPGADFLFARNGTEMKAHLRMLLEEPDTAAELGAHGRATIERGHTCAHRVDELFTIHEQVQSQFEVTTGRSC